MEINVNNLNSKINADWSTVLGNIKGTGATEATSSVNGASRGLTMSVNGDEAITTITTAQPQLDAPQAADESAIATLCAKLGTGDVMNLSPAQVETLCKEVKAELNAYSEALTAASSSGVSFSEASSTVMFDIYALMALLVECGQKMRDAARDVRQAENEQVQTSILNQADAQRSAAMTGLICSVAVCAIQVGMQAYNLSTQGKSFAKQMEAQQASGINDAKAELRTAELQTKPQDALKNFEKVSEATPGNTRASVEATFNDSKTTKLAMTNPEKLQQQIDAKNAELTELKTGGTDHEIPMTKSQQVKAERLTSEINQAEKLKAMTPEEQQTLYRTQLKSELAEIRNNPAATQEELAYAEAYATKELAQNSTPDQLASDLKVAQDNYNLANTTLQHDVNYLKGIHMDTRSRAFGDMIAAIGNVGQGCVSSISEMMRAEATEMGAEQQEAQEMLDQAKDLFTQCQSVIDSVLQLMDSVLQAEVQSMRDAIQA